MAHCSRLAATVGYRGYFFRLLTSETTGSWWVTCCPFRSLPQEHMGSASRAGRQAGRPL